MAPKTAKDSKRRAEGSRAKAAKVPKVDPALQAVVDVLEGDEDLPSGCKTMLLAMLPGSLCVTKDARAAPQDRVVEMIGEIVDAQKSKLQAAVEVEVSKFVGIESSNAELQGKVAEAETALKESSEILASKQAASQEAEQASKDASTSLKEDKAAEAATEESHSKIDVEMKELQEALDTHLASLCGEDFQQESALEHRDAVMTGLNKSTHAFEQTLLQTLPEALLKPPAERGDFDKMVVDTLKKNLGEHLESLKSSLEAAVAAKAERTAAVEASTARINASQDVQLAAETARSEADEDVKAAMAVLEAAKEAHQSFEVTLASAAAERDTKQAALTDFEARNVASFKSMQLATAATMEDASKLGA